MTLNDIFHTRQIDPRHVLVFRHRPHEPALRKVLPWLAAEKPALFNAYQQTQGDKVERVMETMVGSGSVASFIGHEPGKALFVGLYSIVSSRPLTYDEFWDVREYREMKQFGLRGWVRDSTDKKTILWFDLERTDFYESWCGKLVVNWPPPERSWWRRAHRNAIPVAAVLEDSALAGTMPKWHDVELTWSDLGVLPARWRDALAQWRGIYYIFDTSDGRAYVGSAYGESNLLGRWQNYASSGHGGNALLRGRDPGTFVFTILQRVSPDMDPTDVIALESSWKQRLHTRAPYGLNDN